MSIFVWLEYHPTEIEKKKYQNISKDLWTMMADFNDENTQRLETSKYYKETAVDLDLSIFFIFSNN